MSGLRSRLAALGLLFATACAPGPPPPAPPPPPRLPPSFAVFAPSAAAPERKARVVALASRLDDHFRARMQKGRATALVVGVVLDGELVYTRGFGVRDVESKAPVDVDTVFRIASLTKSFTAMAALELRDAGKVALDAPAVSYLPELSTLAYPTRDAAPVTLRLLLTHASGLPDDDFWGSVSFGFDDRDLERLLGSGLSFSSAPGARWEYSNLGYALVGKVVERVSGVRFRDYVTASILRPLGMTATVWEAGDVPPARLAIAYSHEGDKLAQVPRMSDGVFDAAGGLYTSMRDYARYVAYHLAAYPPRDDAEAGPVRRSTLREMHQGQRWTRRGEADAPVVRRTDDGLAMWAGGYGYGWSQVTTCDEEGLIQHGGWEPGYFSSVMMSPRSGLGIVTMATSGGVGAPSVEAAFAILREAGALAPAHEPIVAPALEDARASVEGLLTQWDAALVERLFDPSYFLYPSHADLRGALAKLARDHGRCAPDGPFRAYNRLHGAWRVRCERGAIAFDIGLSPAAPPRLAAASWREELPPDERLSKVAARLAAAIGRGEDATTDLFAETLDRVRTRRLLARLGVDHGTCVVDRPLSGDGRTRAVVRLRCSDAPMDLAFVVDEASGRVLELRESPQQRPDATCWP